MPNWNDVVWNVVDAETAMAALKRAIRQIEHSISERTMLAQTAQANWQGPHRDIFDQRLSRNIADAYDLIDSLERAYRRIFQANQEAILEQRRREQDRQRWEQDREI